MFKSVKGTTYCIECLFTMQLFSCSCIVIIGFLLESTTWQSDQTWTVQFLLPKVREGEGREREGGREGGRKGGREGGIGEDQRAEIENRMKRKCSIVWSGYFS